MSAATKTFVNWRDALCGLQGKKVYLSLEKSIRAALSLFCACFIYILHRKINCENARVDHSMIILQTIVPNKHHNVSRNSHHSKIVFTCNIQGIAHNATHKGLEANSTQNPGNIRIFLELIEWVPITSYQHD